MAEHMYFLNLDTDIGLPMCKSGVKGHDGNEALEVKVIGIAD